MKKLNKVVVLVIASALMAGGLVVSAGAQNGQALFQTKCKKCHSLERAQRVETRQWWNDTVWEMKNKWFSGISDEEAKQIAEYLMSTRSK